MEESLNGLLTPDKIVGYVIFVVIALYLHFNIMRKHKVEIWEAIKGEDKKLQFTEVVMALALTLYPLLVLADVFLRLKASEAVWISIDLVTTGGLVGDVLKKRNNGKGNEQN